MSKLSKFFTAKAPAGRKFILFLILLLALLFILVLKWHFDMKEQIDSLKEKTAVIRAENRADEIFRAEHTDIEAYLEETEEELDRAVKLLPPKTETSHFLSDLEIMAEKSGNRLLALRPGEEETRQDLVLLPLKLTLLGDYFTFCEFLRLLEDHPPYEVLGTGEIKPQGDKLQFDLEIKIVTMES